MPGSFSPVFSFSQADPVKHTFSLMNPLTGIAEHINSLLNTCTPNAEAFASFGYDYHSLTCSITRMGFVALAIHLARIHSQLGLGESDLQYADQPPIPAVLADYVQELGEFTGPDGRLWCLSDFESTVRSLMRCSLRISREGLPWQMSDESWLPTMVDDKRTVHVIAVRLSSWLKEQGFHFKVSDLQQKIFSGDIPPDLEAILSRLSDGNREVVVRLFIKWSSSQQFIELFSDDVGQRVLALLELPWQSKSDSSLCFDINVNVELHAACREWVWNQPFISDMLGVSFHRCNPMIPRASHAYASRLKGGSMNWEVSSFYGLSDEDKSYLCTLGNPLIFGDVPMRYSSTGVIPSTLVTARVVASSIGCAPSVYPQ